MWLMAPNRSHGAAHKFSWQNRLHALPGNVFDKSTPVHRLSMGSRTGSFFWKSAELAFVGALSGLAMSLLGKAETRLRRTRDPSFSPSVEVPSAQRSALGMAASMGVFGNMRYQLVSGVDRMLSDRINFMWVYLLLSSCCRAANQCLGHPTRLYLQVSYTFSFCFLQDAQPPLLQCRTFSLPLLLCLLRARSHCTICSLSHQF